MKLKLFAAALCAAAGVLFCTGCGKTKSDADTIRIGVSIPAAEISGKATVKEHLPKPEISFTVTSLFCFSIKISLFDEISKHNNNTFKNFFQLLRL